MRTQSLAAAAALCAALALPAAAQLSHSDSRGPSAVVGGERRHDGRRDEWGRAVPSVRLESDRDVYGPGERPAFRLRSTGTAFVAVLHITPGGEVEVLSPGSAWDGGRVSGARTLTLAPDRLRRTEGVGYAMAVASSWPLELSALSTWTRRAWTPGLRVAGDPYRAMRRLARLLVPDESDLLDVDRIAYRVGRRDFPAYACYEDFASWDADRAPEYRGCDGVYRRLREDRGYFLDTDGPGRDVYGRWSDRDERDGRDDGYGYKDGRGGHGRGGHDAWGRDDRQGEGRDRYARDPRDSRDPRNPNARRRPGFDTRGAAPQPGILQMPGDTLILPESDSVPTRR